jgi:hypothetical protein
MTAWSSDAEMKAYMHAGAHGAVMRKLLDWYDEAAVTYWTQDSANLPSWEDAHRRLQQEGRRSIVHHPSSNQTRLVIPPPAIGATRERRLK